MRRYLRLYAYFLRFSFSRAMEFRVDFFFRVGMDALWYAVHLAFFTVLFRHTGILGGWNYDEVLVFAATIFFMDALQMTMFSNNLWWFPIFVNKGDLDYYLVRPVSSLFFLSLRDFAANSFLNLLLATGILAWAIGRYPEPLGAGRIGAYFLLQGGGVFLHYTMSMIFILPVFWMQSRAGVRDVYWSLHRLSMRPHRIYTGWMRRLIVSVLPFAFMASYPCMALLEGVTPTLLLHTAAVIGTAFLVMIVLWKRGLRAYASASS
jgi:ABC-2 type transport system permease protein